MSEQREMKQYTLDFSHCRYIGEIYAVCKEALELPEWCGENLDALWDAVTGIMETPVGIRVKGNEKSKDVQEEVNAVISLLREAQDQYNEITVTIISWYFCSASFSFNLSNKGAPSRVRLCWCVGDLNRLKCNSPVGYHTIFSKGENRQSNPHALPDAVHLFRSTLSNKDFNFDTKRIVIEVLILLRFFPKPGQIKY